MYLDKCTYMSQQMKLMYTETPCFGENKCTQKFTQNTRKYILWRTTKVTSHEKKWCAPSIIFDQEHCLELTCVRWPLLHQLLLMLNCPLVLGDRDMTDSPPGPWVYSIVTTSSDADSASAYFSSSDFFDLIIRIVLWWHAMCSITQALCCRLEGKHPIW